MTNNGEGPGLSPDHLVRIFKEPLRHAAISVNFATHGLETAHNSPEKTPAAIEAAERHLAWADKNQAGLQAAGRAALSTIEDFPPESTLRAQMRMYLRPEEEIDAVFGHIEAMDAYARTGNAIIAVVGAPLFRHPWLEDNASVIFVTPESSEDEPAAKVGRSDDGHYLDLRTGRVLLLDIGPESHTALTPSGERASYRSDRHLENAVFAADVGEVAAIFETDFSADTAFVYGDEAVQELINVLGRKKEGFRPLLYGGMNYLDRDYEVEALGSPQAREVAERKFYNDLHLYLVQAISNAGISEADRENFTLLTPETARFIGILDHGVAEDVKRMLSGWSFVGDNAIVKSGGHKAEDAWTDIWGALRGQGFTELAGRMLQPKQSVHSVASIERQVLLRTLEWDTKSQRGSRPPLTRQQIKGINRAIEVATAKIDYLEDDS